MSAIVHSVEIARKAEDVFAYLDELDRHGEWQDQIQSVTVSERPTRVGTRATEVRKMGGREMTISYEIVEHEPPRSFAFRGLDGPVRANGKGRVEPVGDGSGCRVTVELELVGHGLAGKVLAPLARGQADKQVPQDQAKLKQVLESGA